ncbi:PGF-pre-PGF domain-containing protein [Methanolobus sp. WCC5]|uniref:PGF-pre-PGF domain-containing protein n=1 Tax=Methanolobus sp. WCC5 TaxID=3125785 RepID=UPI003248D75C
MVTVSPLVREVNSNQQFDVYINIEPQTPIAGAQLDILFDNNIISAVEVNSGDFFEQDGTTSVFIGGTINNQQGSIKGLFAVTLGKAEICTAGNFAHISFIAGNDTGNSDIILTNVILSDFQGNAVPVTVHNAEVNIPGSTPLTPPEDVPVSAGGSGGGGGGGATGENTENIGLKEVVQLYVTSGSRISFLFEEKTNPIKEISYLSLKNAGFITGTIEVLNDVSSTVSQRPSGVVYRNINIWIGKAGYATDSNIDDTRISFTVLKKWMDLNNAGPDNVHLERYHEGRWETLDTRITGEDEDFFLFEAETPGFSPFAITADVPDVSPGTEKQERIENDPVFDPAETNNEKTKENDTLNNYPASDRTGSAELAQNSSLLLCISMIAILLCRRAKVK